MESLGLDLSKLPLDLILNILNIVLLFLIVRALAYKPIRKFMDARTARVNAAAQEAADKAAEADKVKAEYTALLAQSDEKAQAILDDAKQKAAAESLQIVQDARSEAQTIVENAETEAAKTRADALHGMQDEVVGLAFDISEKLLERSVRDEDTKKMADRLFDRCADGEDEA